MRFKGLEGMRKIGCLIGFSAALLASAPSLYAQDLLQVYKDALQNDPTFQQALANREITQTQIPLNLANLLPQLNATETGSYTRTTVSGPDSTNNSNFPSAGSGKSLGLQLSLSQSVFNWANWMNLVSAHNSVKAAYATYTFSIQDLIQRTAKAYFDVLDAEDQLRFTDAEKKSFYNQYIQAKESYEVGVKTITDVFNAKASYDSAIAQDVQAVNALADANEALAAITGKYYKHLDPLVNLPLINPQPNNIETWTQTAITHNWQLSAAHYNMLSAHDQIGAAEAGHLPNVTFQGSFSNTFDKNIGGSDPDKYREKQVEGELELNVPVYSGGSVTANVQKAIASYNLSSGQFQSTYRSVVEDTRQDFLGVISGVSKVQADQQAVLSQQNSLEGTEEGYRVGTRTMIDVLNVETDLYNALQQNATDRYAYVMSLINLKENAGTLDTDDLVKVNSWLGKSAPPVQIKKPKSTS